MANNQRWLNLAKSILSPLIDSFLKGKSGSDQRSRQGSTTRSGGRAAPRPGESRGRHPAASPGAAGSRSRGGTAEVSASEAAQRGAAYPGDYTGRLDPVYSPQPDGRPDPGEVVWAWVPYEEDHSQGKDRPVLVVGRNGTLLLALMLTSKDHTRDHDRHYIDVGAGAWDRQGRPSEAKLDRVLQLEEAAVRREGAVLSRERFEAVAAALRSL